MKTKLLITTILTSFIASSQVVQSLTPNGFAKPFQIWKDSKDRFEFRIDTPVKAVKVKISPKKFVIKKGQKYYIEPTMDDPFEVEAKENGQLTLNFSNAHYQYVGIWPTTKNYIPSDLNLKSTQSNLGKLTVTGKNAFTWEKNDKRGLYKSDIKKDIILTPGKRYRLTYKYQCNTVPKIWGAFLCCFTVTQ